MASEWAQSHREAWLHRIHASANTNSRRNPPAEHVQLQLLDVIDGMLSRRVSPTDAAAETARLVLSQTDISTPWAGVVNLVLHAAKSFDEERVLLPLADYLVELASLPDAINEGPSAKTIDTGGGVLRRIEPGQAIVFEEGRLWRDLPTFSWNLTENFQGPELYIGNDRSPANLRAARTAWCNLNFYLALITINPKAQTVPVLANMAHLGLSTLAMALEHSPGTRLGQNTKLHTHAAAQWLAICGGQLERLCAEGTELQTAGDLWREAGGSDVCDGARLAFWRRRTLKLGYLTCG